MNVVGRNGHRQQHSCGDLPELDLENNTYDGVGTNPLSPAKLTVTARSMGTSHPISRVL